MAELKLPFPYPKTPHENQANLETLRKFVEDLDTKVESFTGLSTGTLDTTGDVTIGGDESVTGNKSVTGNTTLTGTLTNTDKLVTDTDGAVTQPNQPSFYADSRGGSQTLTWTGGIVGNVGKVIVCGTEQYDLGGDHNTSTGVFTASKDGVYFFSGYAVIDQFTTLNIPDVSFAITATPITPDLGGGTIFTNSATGANVPCTAYASAVLQLDANDTVSIAVYTDGGNSGSVRIESAYFSGTLIN